MSAEGESTGVWSFDGEGFSTCLAIISPVLGSLVLHEFGPLWGLQCFFHEHIQREVTFNVKSAGSANFESLLD